MKKTIIPALPLSGKSSDMHQVETSIVHFKNTEINVKVNENIRRKDVYIVVTGGASNGHSVNDYLMETFLLVDACRRSSANSVNLIIPCFPYARADKKDEPRTPIGGSMVARFFETLKVDRIISMDLHAGQIQGFFQGPFDNLYGIKLFIDYFKSSLFIGEEGSTQDDFVLVAPDAGAVKRIQAYAKVLKMNYAMLHKDRDHSRPNTVLQSILVNSELVKDKKVIVIDDIFDSFGTMNAAINELEQYGVKSVIAVATHGIFSGDAFEKINSNQLIEQVVVTDSLPQAENLKMSEKLRIVPIAPLIAEVIFRLEDGDSISQLFK